MPGGQPNNRQTDNDAAARLARNLAARNTPGHTRPRRNALVLNEAEARLHRNMAAQMNGTSCKQRRNAMTPGEAIARAAELAAARHDDTMHMESARLGVIYLFANLVPSSKIISVGVEGLMSIGVQTSTSTAGKAVTSGFTPLSGNTSGAAEKVMLANALDTGGDSTDDHSVLSRCAKWMEEFIKGIFAELKMKYGSEPKTQVKEFKSLINLFVRIFAEGALPFVKGGLDIVKGIYNAGRAIMQNLRTWMKSMGTKLTPGHPADTAKALEYAMKENALSGLYTTLKGGVTLGLGFATAGASAIVNMCVAFAEAAVKIVWRLFEFEKVMDFHLWCVKAFAVKNSPSAPHLNPVLFAEKYRAITKAVPTVAAIVLKSKICGDKIRWINSTGRNGEPDYDAFKRGVAYLDSLIPVAEDLIDNMGFNLNPKGPVGKSMLETVKETKKPTTRTGKVLQWGHNLLTY